jgi:hypothetical protein
MVQNTPHGNMGTLFRVHNIQKATLLLQHLGQSNHLKKYGVTTLFYIYLSIYRPSPALPLESPKEKRERESEPSLQKRPDSSSDGARPRSEGYDKLDPGPPPLLVPPNT